MKKDVKKGLRHLISSLSFRGNRNNKRGREYKGENAIRNVNIKLSVQILVKRKRIRKKEISTKIKVTKRFSDSNYDDFDAHVFMIRGDDDDDIMDEQLNNDGMIAPY